MKKIFICLLVLVCSWQPALLNACGDHDESIILKEFEQSPNDEITLILKDIISNMPSNPPTTMCCWSSRFFAGQIRTRPSGLLWSIWRVKMCGRWLKINFPLILFLQVLLLSGPPPRAFSMPRLSGQTGDSNCGSLLQWKQIWASILWHLPLGWQYYFSFRHLMLLGKNFFILS